jgi:hypothetical protein
MLRPSDEQWERIQEHIPEEHVSPVTMVVNRYLPARFPKPFCGFSVLVPSG